MKSILAATTAGLLVLVFTATAPAQPGSNYSGGSYYTVPSQQYIQPVYPSNYYAQPQFSGSFNYSSPSFGLGINVNPSYGSSYGIYFQPYGPNYYPIRPFVPSHNHHHHHHHHHGHR